MGCAVPAPQEQLEDTGVSPKPNLRSRAPGRAMPACFGSKAGHLEELVQVSCSLFPFSLAVAAAALAWSPELCSHLPVSHSSGKVQGDPRGSASAGMLRTPCLGFGLWGSAAEAVPSEWRGCLSAGLGGEKSWGPSEVATPVLGWTHVQRSLRCSSGVRAMSRKGPGVGGELGAVSVPALCPHSDKCTKGAPQLHERLQPCPWICVGKFAAGNGSWSGELCCSSLSPMS